MLDGAPNIGGGMFVVAGLGCVKCPRCGDNGGNDATFGGKKDACVPCIASDCWYGVYGYG